MQLVLFVLFILYGVSAQKQILFLKLNQTCKHEKEPWVCKKSSQCNGLKEGIKNGKIEICGFSGTEPIICCPPSSSEITNKSPSDLSGKSGAFVANINDTITLLSLNPNAGKKAEQMCREYAKYVFVEIESPILRPGSVMKPLDSCAITAETLIVGGTPAKYNEFPHMALLGVKGNLTVPRWFCGGSLISPRFILSAAHCNVSQNLEKLIIVRLGELDLLEDNAREEPIDVKIIEAFDHPHYDFRREYHDISLLKMERDVDLGPSIRPLCLNTKRTIDAEKALATGWGLTAFEGNASNILQKVKLNLVSDERCSRTYAFTRDKKLPEGIIPKIMFCAGGVKGYDTCQGDSGGPLQIVAKDVHCMYKLIGVTSFGVNCSENIPGGYTRVSNYVPWIESIVWP